MNSDFFSGVGRTRVRQRLDHASTQVADPTSPLVVIDLDQFDANAADLARRANGKRIRVASKSLRVPALISRALSQPSFSGVLAYSLREALWLVEHKISADVVVAYPTVDHRALAQLVGSPSALAAITLMVDDPAHVELLRASHTSHQGAAAIRVALDIDAGLQLHRWHLGPKRSPLHSSEAVETMLDLVAATAELKLVGVMTYEGQVAGVPDEVPGARLQSAAVRTIKALSLRQLTQRRRHLTKLISSRVELEFWNAGGSGSLEATAADAAVTELAAGSGLLVPTLFDHYRSFKPRPAAFYGVPVVRRPNRTTVTVAGGGFIASGSVDKDKAPLPWAPPGLQLTSLEGAGEVQTPLTGPGTNELNIGDWVWFRHAKSGELSEHAAEVHLIQGPGTTPKLIDTVPTYRGLGNTW